MFFCLGNIFIIDLIGYDLFAVFNVSMAILIIFCLVQLYFEKQEYTKRKKAKSLELQQSYLIELQDSHLSESAKQAKRVRKKQIEKILSE